jgi:hypothetical protein
MANILLIVQIYYLLLLLDHLNKHMYNREHLLPTVLVLLIFKIPLIKRMKLELQNYAVLIPTENSCIRFNN